jgi:hypothetical protein
MSWHKKDDPWSLVKLIPETAKQERALKKAIADRAAEKAIDMQPDRFTAYKTSVDGLQTRRDFRHALTIEDVLAFPFGLQNDAQGSFVWSYGINNGDRT